MISQIRLAGRSPNPDLGRSLSPSFGGPAFGGAVRALVPCPSSSYRNCWPSLTRRSPLRGEALAVLPVLLPRTPRPLRVRLVPLVSQRCDDPANDGDRALGHRMWVTCNFECRNLTAV